ncbi:hypothetical protein MASR2M29_08380 [Spirochaetota bacterium]
MFLLLPVLLLLLAILRIRKRVVYPHELLIIKSRSKTASLPAAIPRLYYDLILDILCAVIIASHLSSWPKAWPKVWPKGRAVVIDCSRSMLAGYRGDRPIDLACEDFLSGQYDDARLFLLGNDPSSLKPELKKADKTMLAAAKNGPEAIAFALEKSLPFLGADPELIRKLARYKEIIFLTDNFVGSFTGLKVVQYGLRNKPVLYPLEAYREDGWYKRLWLAKGGAEPEALFRLHADNELTMLAPDKYSQIKLPEGFLLAVKEPGSYMLNWQTGSMPFGTGKELPGLKAKGEVPEMAKKAILGWLSKYSDYRLKSNSFTFTDKKTAKNNSLSIGIALDDPLVVMPEKSLGLPLAAAHKKGYDTSIGPAGLASGETALSILSMMLQKNDTKKDAGCVSEAVPAGAGGAAPAADQAMAVKGKSLLKLGEAVLYNGKAGTEILRAGIHEYWPYEEEKMLAIPRTPRKSLPTFFALFIILVLKLALASWLNSGFKNHSARKTRG